MHTELGKIAQSIGYAPTHPPTHPPTHNPQQLVRTTSSSSTFLSHRERESNSTTHPPIHPSERTNLKTGLQKQLERLAIGLFLFALLLGFVVIAVNKFR